jgi:6-phosphogluconolactonase
VAMDPKGQFAYDSETGIAAYSLAGQQISLLPNSPTFYGDTQNNPLTPDQLKMDPSGQFLYASFYPSNFATPYGDFGVVMINPDGSAGAFASGSPAPSCYVGGDLAIAKAGSSTFVYESCADINSDTNFNIDTFAVDAQGGLTTGPAYKGTKGGLASGMAADTTGKWLAAVDVNNDQLLVLSIDPKTGKLRLGAGHSFTTGHRPNSVAFDKSGKFLFVSNGDYPWFLSGGSNDISVYSFDPSAGTVTPLSGSPYPSGGTSPSSIRLAQ